MKNRVSTSMAVASLIPTAVVVAGWVLSYFHSATTLVSSHPDRASFAASEGGDVRLWVQQIFPPPPPGVEVVLNRPCFALVSTPETDFRANLGDPSSEAEHPCRLSDTDSRGMMWLASGTYYNFRVRKRQLLLPWWLLSLASLLPAASVAPFWVVRRRRVLAGRCVACDYDLRATPGRCPECGTVPAGA